MAQLNISQVHHLALDVTEFRLIMKGLRGELTEEEEEKAKELSDVLFEQRAKHLQHLGREAEKIIGNIEKRREE